MVSVNDITVTIVQPAPPFYNVIDSTAEWSQTYGTHCLHIGGSGTGGTLRFVCADNGQSFAITIGVHNHKVWGDIVTGLSPWGSTGTANDIYSSYYEKGWKGTENKERCAARWQTRTLGSTTYGGRTISFAYTQDGTNPKLQISIVP